MDANAQRPTPNAQDHGEAVVAYLGLGSNQGDREKHLRRAAELEPEALYHRLWLARLYIERDREEEARPLLEQLLVSPADSPLDRLWKVEAAAELEGLGR